eukprot:m.333900 g.333900  ORF g.333900 m.333900 type:complete len:404 (+) comp16524_c0_seq2:2705-3916(+)
MDFACAAAADTEGLTVVPGHRPADPPTDPKTDPGTDPALIIGVGNPTVDVTALVARADLTALGITPGSDLAGAEQPLKVKVVEAVLSGRVGAVVSRAPGGSALNSIRVAAWGQPASLPVATAFLGAIGDDAEAEIIRDSMAALSVTPLLQAVPGERTAVCAALIEPATRDRALAVIRGAAGHLDPAHLESPAVSEAVASAAVLYASAFVLSTPPRAALVRALAHRASTSNGRTAFALNLSSASLLRKVGPAVLELLPSCRWVFGARDELEVLAETANPPTEAPADLVDKAATAAAAANGRAMWLATFLPSDGCLVVTDGPRPTTIIAGGTTGDDDGGRVLTTYPVPPVPAAEIVDTNGCGDAFVGGFLARAVLGSSVSECVRHGHNCAAAILRRRGCDLSAPL